MRIFQNVHELIGNTPVVEISQFSLKQGVRLFAKLEYLNPGGSVKDRLGIELLQDAFQSGKLRKGGTVIEPTAGNTGIGLALAAINYNIKVILVVPEKFSLEKQVLMKALGATIVTTPTEEGMKGAIDKVLELAQRIPGAYCPQQFANYANPATYYKTLGPELWEVMEGRIDVFVAGAGTGGTFMGTSRFLKEKNPEIKTVIIEPEGSILNGGAPGPHKTEGIGMEFIPEYMDPAYFDQIYTVSDEAAFRSVKEAAVKAGLLIGSSSGAALSGAIEETAKAITGSHIVVVFPDGSERYLSKMIYEGGV